MQWERHATPAAENVHVQQTLWDEHAHSVGLGHTISALRAALVRHSQHG